jgi:hypothetical protein
MYKLNLSILINQNKIYNTNLYIINPEKKYIPEKIGFFTKNKQTIKFCKKNNYKLIKTGLQLSTIKNSIVIIDENMLTEYYLNSILLNQHNSKFIIFYQKEFNVNNEYTELKFINRNIKYSNSFEKQFDNISIDNFKFNDLIFDSETVNGFVLPQPVKKQVYFKIYDNKNKFVNIIFEIDYKKVKMFFVNISGLTDFNEPFNLYFTDFLIKKSLNYNKPKKIELINLSITETEFYLKKPDKFKNKFRLDKGDFYNRYFDKIMFIQFQKENEKFYKKIFHNCEDTVVIICDNYTDFYKFIAENYKIKKINNNKIIKKLKNGLSDLDLDILLYNKIISFKIMNHKNKIKHIFIIPGLVLKEDYCKTEILSQILMNFGFVYDK